MKASGCNGLCLLSAVVESHLDERHGEWVKRSGNRDFGKSNQTKKATSSLPSAEAATNHRQNGTSRHRHDNDAHLGSPISSVSTSPTSYINAGGVDDTASANAMSGDRVSSSLEVIQTSSRDDYTSCLLPLFNGKAVVRDGRQNDKAGSLRPPIRVPRAVKASLTSKRKGSSSLIKSSPSLVGASSSSVWPTVVTQYPLSTPSTTSYYPSTNAPAPAVSPQNYHSHNVFLSELGSIMLPYEDPHLFHARMTMFLQQQQQHHYGWQGINRSCTLGLLNRGGASSVGPCVEQHQQSSRQSLESSSVAIASTITSETKSLSPMSPGIVGQEIQTLPSQPSIFGDSANDSNNTPSTAPKYVGKGIMTHTSWTVRTPPPRHGSLSGAADANNEPTSVSSSSSFSKQLGAWNDVKHKGVPMKEKWMARYEELVEFKKKYGHTKVPHNFEDSPKLAEWQVGHAIESPCV
jgi:hypothetical protein